MANEHSNIVPNMSPTAKVADFKFWCQKVLPLVYDDSLSYYEVLNKMVVYLNQVIDNVNADIDNVEELEADFLLLQSYVNNFFDDIDQLVTYTERAEAAETAANGYAASAAESATNASTSALNAMDARDAAVTAKNQAQAALTNAQTAATSAAESATNAASSALTALDAKDAAAGSALSASGSATNASASATAAQQSFTLADAARVAAQEAAEDAETAAELIDMDATASDVGKAIIVKTVSGGKVTAYEFGEASGGGGTGGIVNTIENVPIASFDDGTNSPVTELVVDIEPIQSGSGNPAPDNIRPFSVRAGVNVTRAGKNLYPYLTIPEYSYNWYSGSKLLADATNPFFLVGGKTYCLSYTNANSDAKPLLRVWKADGTILTDEPSILNAKMYQAADIQRFTYQATPQYYSAPSQTNVNACIISPSEDLWIDSRMQNGKSGSTSVMLAVSEIPLTYKPYTSTPITYTFPDAAGNVYAGTLTIYEDGSGILAVYPYYSSYNGETLTGHWISDRDVYAEGTSPTTGAQVLNDGGTPTEYQLTSQQVITLLQGDNNVWADTGNIILLEYYANSKDYIDKHDSIIKALIAKELPSMIADTALVANDFRIVNNTLYKITASVASGGTLTPGTNCAATTVSEILKTLLT